MSPSGENGTVSKPEVFLDRDIKEAREFRDRSRERMSGNWSLQPLRKYRSGASKTRHVHLVVGDSHAHPEVPNHRYVALGKFVAEHADNIGIVVFMGDQADMPSLLGYDKKSMGPLFDGRRYHQDIDSAVDAMARFSEPIRGLRSKPKVLALMGNHEHRIERCLAEEPRFRGVIGYEDLMLSELGIESADFLEVVDVDGIRYCHYWKSPGSERALAGETLGRASVLKYPGSYSRVCGHSHRFDFYETSDQSSSKKITSVSAGCFFDPSSPAHEWARTDTHRWRTGLLWLEIEGEQIVSWRWIDYFELLRNYL
jgi:hypothetical protein